MRRDLIGRLRCPYTGSRFDVKSTSSNDAGDIDFGIVHSEAGDFPIVSGVLRLLNDDLREPLVGFVADGRHEEALMAALEVPFLSGWAAQVDAVWRRVAGRWNAGLFAHATRPGKQHVHRLINQANVPFAQLAAETGAEAWTKWQTYRFSMPPFLPVYPLAHLAKDSHTILDFGCGLGHSTFLLNRSANQPTTICADYSFTSLFLARRSLVRSAQCVCLDGDYPLPFEREYFDFVFSTDALQYIESKVGLAREFKRVLSEDGAIVLAHLHNGLSPAKTGQALTPAGYDGLFEEMPRRLYPEDSLVSDYVAHGALHLNRRWALNDLDRAVEGLSLVAANSESVFRTYSGLLDAHIDAMRHPHVNPAYHADRSNGKWVLNRRVGPPYAVPRIVGHSEVLPGTWHVAAESLDSKGILELRDADRGGLRELVRRFVVLELPVSYVA